MAGRQQVAMTAAAGADRRRIARHSRAQTASVGGVMRRGWSDERPNLDISMNFCMRSSWMSLISLGFTGGSMDTLQSFTYQSAIE